MTHPDLVRQKWEEIRVKIAICDDERQYIDRICPLLEKWAAQHKIPLTVYAFANGDELITAHKNRCMDLIILDIIMPLLNGIDTARELRDSDPYVPIIFLTSSREFAIDSYEVKAFQYLIKPVSTKKLFEILEDFLKTYNRPQRNFIAQTSDGFYRILLDDIDYLEAQNKKVHVYMTNGKKIEICELFTKCEEILTQQKEFCRCHRSYIVNLKNVEHFSKTAATTHCGATVPISRSRYVIFKESYFNYMFGS